MRNYDSTYQNGELKKEGVMDLSNEVILKDIAGFKDRIAVAQDKLAELKGQVPSNWKEKKRYRAKRREFEGEVVHVNNLIAIARSALNPSKCQPGNP